VLLSHSFTATQQASFYKDLKSGLQLGEVLVTVDFAENYAFVLQDAAQGFHRNNAQATITSLLHTIKNQTNCATSVT